MHPAEGGIPNARMAGAAWRHETQKLGIRCVPRQEGKVSSGLRENNSKVNATGKKKKKLTFKLEVVDNIEDPISLVTKKKKKKNGDEGSLLLKRPREDDRKKRQSL